VTGARDVALAVVRRTFDEGAYSDRAFTAEAARAGLDARERALAMHLAFGTVQRRRTLDAALERLAGRRPERLEHLLAHALRLGAYQLLFSDAIPARAAVDETVSLVRRTVGARATGLANAVLRRVAADGPAWLAALPQATAPEAALRHSLPDWIAELWFSAYGAERGRSLLAAANDPPEVVLRPNPLRAAPGEVERRLAAAGVACVAAGPAGALVLPGGLDDAGSALIADGLAVAQSRASIAAALRVEAAAGMRVLDLCAAPGGKTSRLAAGGARVVAVELHAGRAEALRRTLVRLGADVEVVVADGRTYEGGPFDRVLLDAPCSGLGVLAGRPDARWRRRAEDVPELAALQAQLLHRALSLLAPGGRLVYAVCTLDPAENEAVFAACGLAPRDERRSWPDRDRSDGFYSALAGG
jgi:16S rRNA (cytosine967-C5)-methyltransferase